MTGKHFNKMVITATFPADKWRGQDAWEADANLMAEIVERVLIDGRGFVEIERSTVNLDGEALMKVAPVEVSFAALEFRWVTVRNGLPVRGELGQWHPVGPCIREDGIVVFSGGSGLTLQIRLRGSA